MAFWLIRMGDSVAVNHVSKGAMERYTKRLGDIYRREVGPEFGKTVESFFSDSFEVPNHRNGIYWSPELMPKFRAAKGYDLVRLLPALWWEVDELSPKIRYDVNEFMHRQGMEAFFQVFLGWCERNGVKGRIQPYGFVTDNVEGAGASHIPEMEITAGEKDAVPWFDTRIWPREYVASGAHLYGRKVVSVEAYTYLHWEQARETLEELKISGDIFLRAGANKFYNSGFTGTPEREFVPSRRFTAEVIVSPAATWWRYYRLLSDYVSRCSAVLRQGRPTADIAVYSPLANQWAIDVFNFRRWTRDFDWGMLGKLLLANGYDFDLMNDDVLLHHSRIEGGVLRVRDLEYRILIVPNTSALPLESIERIEEFARQGGVVIALEQTPSASVGMSDHQKRDAEVRRIAAAMFQEPHRDYGRGHTYYLKLVMNRPTPLELHASAMDPFLNTLRKHVAPDMGIDFVGEARRENNGLMFCHRKLAGADVYFVTNVQDQPVDSRLAFRVTGQPPEEWNPYDGRMTPLYEYDDNGRQTTLPVRLAPYESTLLVFAAGPARQHVASTGFDRVLKVENG
ncbi:MAG: glycosyl hydrolase, partial [Acidobacteria bacterium]|nr:glycosyl hydrolase [Acidobacteriota bacterium]